MSARAQDLVEDAVEQSQRLLDARLHTGRWLDLQDFPPLQWAVPGLIPEGMGLLTGPPKAGKSWAALGIGLAVAAGGRAFGRIATGDPRPVLYLALEDGDRRLQDRCRQLLTGEPIPELFHYITTSTADEAPRLITAWLARHGRERPLVMLDTLGKVTPQSLPGESAYARDYRVGGVLKHLVDAYPGSTLLVVHHVRKAGGEDWMDSTSGTNGLNGAADFTINLNRVRGSNDATLRVTGRDVREGEYAMSSVDGSWYLNGRTLDEAEQNAEQVKATANLGDRSSEILAFVASRPEGVKATDVEASLGISDARRYLARLADAGRLQKAARGLYKGCVPSVPSVPTGTRGNLNGTHGTHGTGGVPDFCTECGYALDDLLDDPGATTHPGCS